MIKLMSEEQIKEFLSKSKKDQAAILLNHFHKNLTEIEAGFYIDEFYKKFSHSPTINNFCEFFGFACKHEEETNEPQVNSKVLDIIKELYEEVLSKIGRDGVFLTPDEFRKWCEIKISKNLRKEEPPKKQPTMDDVRGILIDSDLMQKFRFIRRYCPKEVSILEVKAILKEWHSTLKYPISFSVVMMQFVSMLDKKFGIKIKKVAFKEECKCECKQSDTSNAPNGTHMSDEELLEKISEALKYRKTFGIESNIVAALTLLDNMLDDCDQDEFDEDDQTT